VLPTGCNVKRIAVAVPGKGARCCASSVSLVLGRSFNQGGCSPRARCCSVIEVTPIHVSTLLTQTLLPWHHVATT
jgi:hypothetical protein